ANVFGYAGTYSVENGTDPSDNMDLLAPGTTNATAGAIAVAGKPEVAVNVEWDCTITFTGWSFAADWDNVPATAETTEEYCPLIVTLTIDGVPTDYYVGKAGIANVADIKAQIEAAVNDLDGNFDPNEDLAKSVSISWRWEYEKVTVPGQTDYKDTVLGDWAVANNIVFAVELGCTVTQVD
ncbi:MAG: hypothetical protein IKC36_01250, partial [Clostridia bacterium]|nr:hypothetical protein [Clostridia bacterium]